MQRIFRSEGASIVLSNSSNGEAAKIMKSLIVYDMCKTACDIGFAMIGGEALVGSEIMNVILSFETDGDIFLKMQTELAMVNAGLDALCKEFGFEVEFDNQDDFDDFMLDSKRSARFSRAMS